jgi:predicted membrane protein
MEQGHTQKRMLIGFLILAAGMAILLSNLGVLDYEIKRYLLRWEMILIGIGIIMLLSHENKGPGIVFIVIGGAIYARDFFDLNFNFWQLFWPAILILAGIMIIFRRKFEHHPGSEKKNLSDTDDIIDEVAVFGGGDRNIVSQNFQGGKILAIFGGSNFYMTKARLAPGKNYIDILAIFGGLKMVVPEDWTVRINVISVFGGFSDKHKIHVPDENMKPESELIIKGFVLFGGGEIKSY